MAAATGPGSGSLSRLPLAPAAGNGKITTATAMPSAATHPHRAGACRPLNGSGETGGCPWHRATAIPVTLFFFFFKLFFIFFHFFFFFN